MTTPTPVETIVLHYIVHPFNTLNAVYNEHRRRTVALRATLQALEVSDSEITSLDELGWQYMTDRIARERIRLGCPVHHQNVLRKIFAAYEDDNGEIYQSERNLADALQSYGVKLEVILAFVANKNCIYLLADRLALELEKLGRKAECQSVKLFR